MVVTLYPIDFETGQVFRNQVQRLIMVPSEPSTPRHQPPSLPSGEKGLPLKGEPLVAGTQYAPGTPLEIPYAGLTFRLPSSWSGEVRSDAPVIRLVNYRTSRRGWVLPLSRWDPSLTAWMYNPMGLTQSGIFMSLVGSPRQEGNRTWFRYSVKSPGGMIWKGQGLLVSGPYDNGVAILLVGPDTPTEYQKTLTRIVSSLHFFKPRLSEEKWVSRLYGKILSATTHSPTPYTLHLCTNGRFVRLGPSGRDEGIWQVGWIGEQAFLMRFSNRFLWIINLFL